MRITQETRSRTRKGVQGVIKDILPPAILQGNTEAIKTMTTTIKHRKKSENYYNFQVY
jgi:hypothetical protein